jgi:glycerol-3-phosphate cytidylyltransferase
MCKKLIVGVSSNKLIKKHKYNNPILSLKHRMKVIQALQCVDEVVIQDKLVDIKQFKRLKADLFVIGDDWINRHDVPGLEWLRENNKVIFLPYTKEVSSSLIKEKIINNADAILDAQKARKLNG